MALPVYSAIDPVVISQSNDNRRYDFTKRNRSSEISSQDWLNKKLFTARRDEYIHRPQASQGGSFFLTDFSAPGLHCKY
jgi:hypothetical protein